MVSLALASALICISENMEICGFCVCHACALDVLSCYTKGARYQKDSRSFDGDPQSRFPIHLAESTEMIYKNLITESRDTGGRGGRLGHDWA